MSHREQQQQLRASRRNSIPTSRLRSPRVACRPGKEGGLEGCRCPDPSAAGSMALRREISAVEDQYAEADEQYTELSRKLRLVTQERLNTEEELLTSNVRLKQLLGELQVAREVAQAQSNAVVQDNKMTMGELTRKVESTLMTVLDERFRDEAFTSAITEQSVLSTDKVRVEFEGDEVFWSLQDNYSFEMLLGDASRYWDVAPQDAILVDERGAIWPNDAYVGLELQRAPNARITLKIKPVATTVRHPPAATRFARARASCAAPRPASNTPAQPRPQTTSPRPWPQTVPNLPRPS